MGVEVEEIEIEPWTETVLGHPGLGAIGENKYDDLRIVKFSILTDTKTLANLDF